MNGATGPRIAWARRSDSFGGRRSPRNSATCAAVSSPLAKARFSARSTERVTPVARAMAELSELTVAASIGSGGPSGRSQ